MNQICRGPPLLLAFHWQKRMDRSVPERDEVIYAQANDNQSVPDFRSSLSSKDSAAKQPKEEVFAMSTVKYNEENIYLDGLCILCILVPLCLSCGPRHTFQPVSTAGNVYGAAVTPFDA